MLLQTFNYFNDALQFTTEEEDQFSVPFVDTKLFRKSDNTIVATVNV